MEPARSIELFIGPPADDVWERCTIWIRDDESEHEIAVVPGESGRDYVFRVAGVEEGTRLVIEAR